MSEFGILDSRYRLIETQFLDDWVVFKAVEVESERTVCIRTPNEQLLGDPSRYEAFRKSAAGLRQEVAGAPRYYAPGTFDQRAYVVSTWADVTLEGLLHERDGLTTEHALHLLEQCLASLGPIAANGFSHGGLTPQDLGVTESEVLIDTLRMTTTSARLEAQAYLAPEVVGTGTQPDPRSDIYTIGVIAYRMLLGRDRFGRTFEHNQPGIALPALSVLRPDIPAAICHVIERMVLPEAADRFSSATLAHQALKEALDVSDLERSSDPSGVDTPSPANVSTHDVENEPVGRELAPSAPSLASPTEITAPERARQHRSALPAFVTVALLLITIGGAWYAWQFIYEKKTPTSH